MRKSRKQMIIAAATCAMVGAMAVGGTMAYLTDSETATNTFTIGKVQIDLEEPNYPGNNSNDVKNLVPNQIVQKDPQIENTGENPAIVFLKVEVPKQNVIVAAADGTKQAAADTQLFSLLNLDTDDAAGNWVQIDSSTAEADKNVYVYAYKTALAKGDKTHALFDSVQLVNVIEGQIDASTQNIKVDAYAIQSTEILSNDVDLTDTLNKDSLKKIYDIYVKQNAGINAPDADTSHAKDLKGDNL